MPKSKINDGMGVLFNWLYGNIIDVIPTITIYDPHKNELIAEGFFPMSVEVNVGVAIISHPVIQQRIKELRGNRKILHYPYKSVENIEGTNKYIIWQKKSYKLDQKLNEDLSEKYELTRDLSEELSQELHLHNKVWVVPLMCLVAYNVLPVPLVDLVFQKPPGYMLGSKMCNLLVPYKISPTQLSKLIADNWSEIGIDELPIIPFAGAYNDKFAIGCCVVWRESINPDEYIEEILDKIDEFGASMNKVIDKHHDTLTFIEQYSNIYPTGSSLLLENTQKSIEKLEELVDYIYSLDRATLQKHKNEAKELLNKFFPFK